MLNSSTNALVIAGPDPGTVTKIYRDTEYRSAHEAAQVERDRMTKLHAALADVEGVTCPRPLDSGQRDGSWYLTTTAMDGEDLRDLVRSPVLPSPVTVGQRLASALEVYVHTFHEPHFDMEPKNILIEPATCALTILDLEPSDLETYLAAAVRHAHPAVTSAGVFLGGALHYAAAPRNLLRLRGRRWLVDTGIETVRALTVENRRGVGGIARAIYRMNVEKRPAAWRRVWYPLRWYDLGRPALRRAVAVDG